MATGAELDFSLHLLKILPGEQGEGWKQSQGYKGPRGNLIQLHFMDGGSPRGRKRDERPGSPRVGDGPDLLAPRTGCHLQWPFLLCLMWALPVSLSPDPRVPPAPTMHPRIFLSPHLSICLSASVGLPHHLAVPLVCSSIFLLLLF